MLCKSDLLEWAEATVERVAAIALARGWTVHHIEVARRGPRDAALASRYLYVEYRGLWWVIRVADHRTTRGGAMTIKCGDRRRSLHRVQTVLRALADGIDARQPARRRIGGAA